MDRNLWTCLVSALRRAERVVRRRLGPEKKVRYPSTLIARMYLWQVAHDQTMLWACQRGHYSNLFRPRKLPSYSQYTRRVPSPRVQQLLEALHDQLCGLERTPQLSYLDGKLLGVSNHSHDREATKVRVNRGYVRGYRLHAWAGEDHRIKTWAVTGAHAGEQTIARLLCQHMPALSASSVVLGDARFDSSPLYADVACRGGALFTPLLGMAKHPKTRRQMSPARLEAIEVWEQAKSLGRLMLRQRIGIEQVFSQLCATGGGLTHLPPWVRTLKRVRLWVGVKIILHNARVQLRQQRKQDLAQAG